MTHHPLLELLRNRPFRPFRVVMSGGQQYEVRQPDAAFLTQNDILIGIDIADDGIPDRFKICSLSHVTAVDPIDHRASYP